MSKVAIVYHSGFGHTAEQARAVKRGVELVEGTTARLLTVEEIDEQWEELASADAIIFGSPTYMGSVSGPFKTFMDKSSKAWFEQRWKNKIAAGFTISGSPSGDKLNVLTQLAVFAAQHGMIWVGLDVMPRSKSIDGEDLNRLGSFLGAMAQASDESPESATPKGDLLTAEHLGRRVAQAVKQWAHGSRKPQAETVEV